MVDGGELVVFKTGSIFTLAFVVRYGVPDLQGIQERLPVNIRQVSDLSPGEGVGATRNLENRDNKRFSVGCG